MSVDLFKFSPEFDKDKPAGLPSNSYYLNTLDLVTLDGEFPPVIGNVLVWRDKHHVTDIYARTCRSFFEQSLNDFVPELFE